MTTGSDFDSDHERDAPVGPAGRAVAFIGFAVGLSAATAGLYLGAVRTYTGQRADEAALVGRATESHVQNATNHILNTISISSLLLGSAALTLLALSRRRPRLAVGVAIMIVAANLSTQLLKSSLLDRPDLLHRPGAPVQPSFPSGHAAVAMSLALGFLLVVPARSRVIAGAIGFGYAVCIGAATLTAGWHRPSDVIGAYFIASAYTSALVAYLIGSRGTGGGTRARAPTLDRLLSSERMFVGGAWALLAAFVAMAGVSIVLGDKRLTSPAVGVSYVGAVAAIFGVALVLLAVLLRLLRGVLLDAPHTRTAGDPTP